MFSFLCKTPTKWHAGIYSLLLPNRISAPTGSYKVTIAINVLWIIYVRAKGGKDREWHCNFLPRHVKKKEKLKEKRKQKRVDGLVATKAAIIIIISAVIQERITVKRQEAARASIARRRVSLCNVNCRVSRSWPSSVVVQHKKEKNNEKREIERKRKRERKDGEYL